MLFDEANIEIGRRIETRRKILRMTGRELGAALGVSHQQIYKYECGKDRLSIQKLKRLAEVLKTDISYFLGQPNNLPMYLEASKTTPKVEKEVMHLAKDYIDISDQKIRTALGDLVHHISRNFKKT